MPEWSEDFSEPTLEEIVRSQNENKVWAKQFRFGANALVNSRLAKHISPEEYAAKRKLANEDAAECKRRATVLADETTFRHMRCNAVAKLSDIKMGIERDRATRQQNAKEGRRWS
jgi:DeoR/GlpR family transcriptional regulator of sugar metabolism